MDVLRITRWGGYPELSGWVQYNHKEGRKAVGKKGTTTEAEAGVMCFEDLRYRGHGPQDAGGTEKLEGKEIDAP